MRLLKKIGCFLTIGMLIMTIVINAEDTFRQIKVLKNNVSIYVDNKKIDRDNFVYNDTTYVPIRNVSEALGAKVEWNEDDKIVNIQTKPDKQESKEGSNKDNAIYVSIINLIATPERYNDKYVKFEGYSSVFDDNEDCVIFLSEDDYMNVIEKNGIYLNLSNKDKIKDIESGDLYGVCGKFNMEDTALNSSGGLDDAQIIYHKYADFTTNKQRVNNR